MNQITAAGRFLFTNRAGQVLLGLVALVTLVQTGLIYTWSSDLSEILSKAVVALIGNLAVPVITLGLLITFGKRGLASMGIKKSKKRS
jgi:hypothetical protein